MSSADTLCNSVCRGLNDNQLTSVPAEIWQLTGLTSLYGTVGVCNGQAVAVALHLLRLQLLQLCLQGLE